ncbi:MAG: hypothetical protein QF714_08300, partial [Dehalococcoidia bacterium]|nr:hypothetical protein [Dehalococcoidia bacterium]
MRERTRRLPLPGERLLRGIVADLEHQLGSWPRRPRASQRMLRTEPRSPERSLGSTGDKAGRREP